MSNQLIKTTGLGKENVFPRTRILDLFDDTSGLKLIDILNSFNMMFVPYLGNKSYTRNQISPELRRQGLWLTYVIDNTVYTEWYGEVAIDDTNWGSDSNWRQGSNALVGDLSISPNGTWVINGEDSGITIKGDKGDSPVIRIYDNKILVSYDKGVTYEDLNNIPIYTKFRFNSLTNTYLVSYDLGGTWLDISDEKVYHKFRYNSTTNTYLESIDFGKTWSNISAEKVYYQFRYNEETNTHLVSTDLGLNWTDVSSNKVYYLFRTNNNRLLVSTNLGTTWENCSEPIAAWFRWADTSGTGNVGKVLISRDNSTWEDLSPNIINNLYIKGYVSTVGNLPSSAAIGDIYMVGPTYDESDTTLDYPHYRMWVKLSSGWIDNGEYLSNVLVTQDIINNISTGNVPSTLAVQDYINTISTNFATKNSVEKLERNIIGSAYSAELTLNEGVQTGVSLKDFAVTADKQYKIKVNFNDVSPSLISFKGEDIEYKEVFNVNTEGESIVTAHFSSSNISIYTTANGNGVAQISIIDFEGSIDDRLSDTEETILKLSNTTENIAILSEQNKLDIEKNAFNAFIGEATKTSSTGSTPSFLIYTIGKIEVGKRYRLKINTNIAPKHDVRIALGDTTSPYGYTEIGTIQVGHKEENIVFEGTDREADRLILKLNVIDNVGASWNVTLYADTSTYFNNEITRLDENIISVNNSIVGIKKSVDIKTGKKSSIFFDIPNGKKGDTYRFYIYCSAKVQRLAIFTIGSYKSMSILDYDGRYVDFVANEEHERIQIGFFDTYLPLSDGELNVTLVNNTIYNDINEVKLSYDILSISEFERRFNSVSDKELFIKNHYNKNVDDTGTRFLISLIENTCNGNILYGQQKEFTINFKQNGEGYDTINDYNNGVEPPYCKKVNDEWIPKSPEEIDLTSHSGIYNMCGHNAGILAIDFEDYSNATSEDMKAFRKAEIIGLVRAFWKKTHGAITICYHCRNPYGVPEETNKYGVNPEHPYVFFDILNDVEVDGIKVAYNWFYNDFLPTIKMFFDEFVVDGEYIPILFRPFHECNVHFWGNSSSSDYISIWKIMVDYIRLNSANPNILYVYNPNFSWAIDPNLSFSKYAGDDYVDIVSTDCYFGEGKTYIPKWKYVEPFAELIKGFVSRSYNHGKLFALAETGDINQTVNNFYTTQLLKLLTYPNIKVAYTTIWFNQPTWDTYIYTPWNKESSEGKDYIKFLNDGNINHL